MNTYTLIASDMALCAATAPSALLPSNIKNELFLAIKRAVSFTLMS